MQQTNPNKTHISEETYFKLAKVARGIKFLRAARMRSIAEAQKSNITHSKGPCDAQAKESATVTALQSNARTVEGSVGDIFANEGKKRRVEVITIDSDEEGSNDCLPVKNLAGSYGKLWAENSLKEFKEQHLLKENGNSGTSTNNYKGKEVAVDVSPMTTPCEHRSHDTNTNVSSP